METTETLNANNNSRKLVPSKYVWGQFTPDFEGKGYSELPEQSSIDEVDTFGVYSQNGERIVQLSLANLRTLFNSYIEEVALSVLSSPGMLMPFAGTTPPPHWMLCEGQALSRLDYPALYAAIGTTYGPGSGEGQSFSLPDLRGKFLKGRDVGEPLGQYNPAGVPDITGEFGWLQCVGHTPEASGVFTVVDKGLSGDAVNGASDSSKIGFRASKISPVYGRSTTVTPDNISVHYIIRT